MLSEAMQRRYVMLMCLRCSETLETLHETEIAFQLRLSEAELNETKQLFISKNFIDRHWNLLNWDKRQFVSDSSTMRVAKHREKKKQESNIDETLQKRQSNAIDTDTDTDKNQIHRSKATGVACPPDVDQQIWDDWKQLRKAKKAPVTETVVNSARKEASKANMSFSDFLTVWCARGSQGLQADWLKPEEKNLSKTGQMNQRVISGLTRGLIGGGNVKLLGN
jgi:flagellar biosynthesis GTPase FlhF